NDTIYFDIPYYYPVDSDFETDLSKIIVRATISSDAEVSVKFGEVMDLREPLDFNVISGTGVATKYVIKAKRVGDTSISNPAISFENDGAIETVDGILIDDELRSFVLPGLDMSQSTFTFNINKHASSSVASGTVLDLNTAKDVTISAPGDIQTTYKLAVMEPVRLGVGFGRHRWLGGKEAAEFGISGTNERAIAVSGDYLVITRTGTAGTSRYSVYNRFTGEYVRELYMPYTAASGALSATRQLVADENGHLLAMNYATWGNAIRIYKYEDPFDDSPELFISTTNNHPIPS